MSHVVEIEGGRVRIELQIGGSSISKQMVAAINQACSQAEDLGPRAFIVVNLSMREQDTGGSPEFDRVDLHLISQWERALARLENAPGLTLACAEDDCFGTKLELLLTTDYRLAKPSVQIGLAQPGLAIRPGMAVHRLSSQLGIAHARPLVLLGRHIDANEARRIGLIDEISDDPWAASASFIKSLTPSVTQDWSVRRRLLLEAIFTSHQEALGTHLAACDRHARCESAA
jgi:isomerase DpgB